MKEGGDFAKKFFEYFWGDSCPVVYYPYGSRIEGKVNSDDKGYIRNSVGVAPELSKKQQEIKNSPSFYQQAPFLTIAEDLLKLIKKDKVEQLIFLSAYDKRKFPGGDDRKIDIFLDTFFELNLLKRNEYIDLKFIGFDSETQGRTKAD